MSSSSSSTSASSRGQLTTSALRKHLEILDSIPTLSLPATLPPSPPPSPPSLKRRLEDSEGVTNNKRPRIDPAPSWSTTATTSSSPAPPPADPDAPTAVPPMRSLDIEFWAHRHQHYMNASNVIRRSANARAHKSKEHLDAAIAFVEQADAIVGYAYAYWLQDTSHSFRTRGVARTYAGNAWQPLEDQFRFAHEHAKNIFHRLPRDHDPRLPQRVTTLRQLLTRLEGFVVTLCARRLQADSMAAIERIERASTASPPGQQPTPPAVASPSGHSPPTAPSPSSSHTPSAMTTPTASQLQTFKRALSAGQRAADKIGQALEAPELKPDALASTFPRTHRRLRSNASTSTQSQLREPSPRNGARDEYALELDAAAGASPDSPANTVLEWPMTPLTHVGAGVGPLCLSIRAMLWELGADIGYKYTTGAIVP